MARNHIVLAAVLTTALSAAAIPPFLGWAMAEDAATGAPARAEKSKRVRHEEVAAAPTAPATPPAPAAPAEARRQICLLDRGTILSTAAINVASSQRLVQLRAAAQDEIVAANKGLQADGKALDEDRRPPTDEALKKAREMLADRARGINQRAAVLGRELQATEQSVNAQIQGAAAPIVQAVEREQGCGLLLAREGVIDPQSTVDITQAVLQRMDAQIRPQPFDRVHLAVQGSPPAAP